MQNPGPWDLWLLGLEKSRLFAQGALSARCAPLVCHKCDKCSMFLVTKMTWENCAHAIPPPPPPQSNFRAA